MPLRSGARELKAATKFPSWIIGLALFIVVAAVFIQVQNHEFVNYDDNEYVTDNSQVREGLNWTGVRWAFTSVAAANWHPVTWLSHMLDVQLFGVRSDAHHLINVGLHGVNTVLLFAMLRRLTQARWPSAFVAFVFGLHPLHVESVAWVAERKDVLSGLFWLLAMWAYVRYTERQSLVRYLLVVAAFACGLMSKPMVVTLPFVLLLLDLWPLRRVGSTRPSRLILEKVPLLLLAAGSSIVTYLVQQRAGAVSSLDYVPFAIRIQNALITYVLYLGQFFWPANLAVVYPYTEPEIWRAVAAGLLLAGVTALAIRQWSRRPYLLVGWFWYLGTLVPVIGLVQVGVQSRADRYTYLPMVGIAILLAWAGAELAGRMGGAKAAVVGLAGVAAAGWLIVTGQQIGYWQDSIALFRRTVSVTEGNYIAHGNLGAALRNSGHVEEAVAHFEIAQKLHPADARLEENLGEALLALDRISEAIPHLQQSIRLQPTFSKPHVDLGSAFAKTGRMEEAATAFRYALRLAPLDPGAHYGLGTVLLARGLRDEARPHLEKSLPQLIATVNQQPDQPDQHFNLGALYDALGRNEDAIVQFAATVRLRPQDIEAWFKLGASLTNAGRYDEAIRAFSEAIRLKPDFADARRGLDHATRAQQKRQ